MLQYAARISQDLGILDLYYGASDKILSSRYCYDGALVTCFFVGYAKVQSLVLRTCSMPILRHVLVDEEKYGSTSVRPSQL